jgi:hypothetical protein
LRAYGRHRVRQRSNRAAVLFLLAVASFKLLGAADAISAWRSHGRPLRSPPKQNLSAASYFLCVFFVFSTKIL